MGILVRHSEAVEARPVTSEGADKVTLRWLIDENDFGASKFVMRQFDLAPGGHTPRHRHPWEHEVFVLAGQGAVMGAGGEHCMRAVDAVLVPSDEEHQFVNTGPAPLRFLCLIPVQQTPA